MGGPPIHISNSELRSRTQHNRRHLTNPKALPRNFSITVNVERSIAVECSHPVDNIFFDNLYNEMETSLRLGPALRQKNHGH